MGITEWVAVISVVVALLSLAHQQHLTRQQNKSEAKARQYDRTTALLFKALDNPDLLESISGDSDKDQRQRRFRQIWINHNQMIFGQRRVFTKSEWSCTVADMKDFMNFPEIQQHWQGHEQYYEREFRSFVNLEIFPKKEGSPKNEPPSESVDEVQASTT